MGGLKLTGLEELDFSFFGMLGGILAQAAATLTDNRVLGGKQTQLFSVITKQQIAESKTFLQFIMQGFNPVFKSMKLKLPL